MYIKYFNLSIAIFAMNYCYLDAKRAKLPKTSFMHTEFCGKDKRSMKSSCWGIPKVKKSEMPFFGNKHI